MRFPDRERHQLFLEPEGLDVDEIYVNGFSMSLPADVQERARSRAAGLEDAEMIRPGYAVEYDFIQPTELDARWRRSRCPGCSSPGRSTGRRATRRPRRRVWWPASTRRAPSRASRRSCFGATRPTSASWSTTSRRKGCLEPYRMFTSRAEHRLLLRIDNADLRLTPAGASIGLVDDERWERFSGARARSTRNRETRRSEPSSRCRSGARVPAPRALKQPEVRLERFDRRGRSWRSRSTASRDIDVASVETEFKYEGYLRRQAASRRAPAPPRRPRRSRRTSASTGSRPLARDGRAAVEVRPGTLGQALGFPA